uniref:BPTI/Kunitz inhibitor domain-containing protein n=1 Tax=Meloidogyne floridensis TaxID=298350 RepID=A0A915NI79_9BILA
MQPLNYGNCSRKLPRFYWDVKSGQCLNGCGGNRNRFLNKRKCRKRCSPKQHKHRKTKIIAKLSIQNQICAQPFDRRYERQCLINGNENNLQARWYFSINSGRCRLFWYGGCQLADAQNFFLDQQLEGQKQFLDGREEGMNTWNDNYLQTNRISTQSSQKHCLEPFDHSLRRPCAIGIWKQRYFFDSNILRCRPFWIDASCFREEIMNEDENSYSKDLNNYFKRPRNLFNNLIECQQICEGRTYENYNVCRPFWYNGCKLNSNNYFENEESCKEICEKERENLTINKDKYSYFGIGEETTTKILNKTSKYFPILTKTEKYIRSKPLIMDENECTQFYYHAKTKEKVGGLKVFLCLLEEGGQCQMNLDL